MKSSSRSFISVQGYLCHKRVIIVGASREWSFMNNTEEKLSISLTIIEAINIFVPRGKRRFISFVINRFGNYCTFNFLETPELRYTTFNGEIKVLLEDRIETHRANSCILSTIFSKRKMKQVASVLVPNVATYQCLFQSGFRSFSNSLGLIAFKLYAHFGTFLRVSRTGGRIVSRLAHRC